MSDPIQHVVVLMLENHSFDQMLGALTEVYPDLDGVKRGAERSNRGMDARRDPKILVQYEQLMTIERQMMLDPMHEVEHVAVQLKDGNAGFVKDLQASYSNWTTEQSQQIMSYYKLDCLPALHSLGRNFTVCDRWFSSLPGPTWPNRFFALSGTSLGRVNMPEKGHWGALTGFFQQTQPTIFDRLNDKSISWNIFFHDFPVSLIFDRLRLCPYNRAQYRTIENFFVQASGPASAFPQFSFIEPRYNGYDQNDDHPPHDVMKAQNLIADIYNAIRKNAELWASTLFVVFYDEHGGFYDHVVPPSAVPPDDKTYEYSFDQLGIRVPALLISPWVDARVERTQFDHTSLLRYLQKKWGLGDLGRRTASANSIDVALRTTPRADTPEKIRTVPAEPAMDQQAVTMDSAHHSAIAGFVRFLDQNATIAYVDAAQYLEEAKDFVTKFLRA